MSAVLAIDPGTEESAYALIDVETRRPLKVGKVGNNVLRDELPQAFDITGGLYVAIEMVASYGMPVGAEVFETCVWIGRFIEVSPAPVDLVYRLDVKKHHCHTGRDVHDSNVAQALIDRFAKGERNRGKGTKAEPGWFHGFHTDIWQAYALAVLVADVKRNEGPL